MKARSLFWPFTLIATGAIWFLVNFNVIPSENLWALTYYWPFLLIAAGLGLILRSRWASAGVLVSALVVIGAVLVIVYAPQLGWNRAPVWALDTASGGFTGSVAGSGKVVSETRELKSFDTVTFKYPANVVIRPGDSESITIEAEGNLMKQLVARISGNVLYFENSESSWSKRVNPTRTVQVILTVKDLHEVTFARAGGGRIEGLKTDALKVTVSGAGNITLTKVTLGQLGIWLSGAGSVNADGTASSTEVHISGAGNFNGKELAVQTADVTISGLGKVILWVKDTLKADISGSGSIQYYGSPKVQQHISGLGSVQSLGNK
jgi:hypothetical protein